MKRALVGLALVTAGCTAMPDQYLIVLDSDLAYPGDIAQIEIAAYEEGTTSGDGTILDLAELGLPASIGVMPLESNGALVVQAQATDSSGNLVVARRMVLHERPDGLVRVTMFLSSTCRGVVCQQSETCTEMGCESADGSAYMRGIGEGEDLVDLCRPGEGSCTADGRGYRKCERYGGPEVEVSCDGDEVCDPSRLACVDEDDKSGDHVTIDVRKVGGGAGHVHSTDYAIDCGSTCTVEVDRGTFVDLRAIPDGSSRFATWEGDCGGPGTCAFTANEDVVINARFEPDNNNQQMVQLEVQVHGSGGGTVRSMPDGMVCSGGTCYAQFPHGTVVTLMPEPDGSSAFSSWFGDCNGRGTCSIRMDGPRWVSANFTFDNGGASVSLDVFQGGTGFGYVSSMPAGIDCGVTCNAIFSRNTNVRLVATPEPGHQFIEWQGACTGTGDCVVDMATNLEVVAIFDDPNFQAHEPEDVNGDGFADLVYGAPGAAGGNGAVYVTFGPRGANDRLDASGAERIYTGPEPGSGFGTAIAVGDLDADGHDDIAIGAPFYDGRGAVFVLFGGPGLVGSMSPPVTIRGQTVGGNFGATVEIHDMDLDAAGELLVGAPGSGPTAFGNVYVFPGHPGFSPSVTTAYIFDSGTPGDAFGTSIEVVGDIDLDGWPDVAVGAPKWGPTGDSPGRVSLYMSRAGPSNPSTSPYGDVILEGPAAMTSLGWSITRLADFNADGADDFAIGSPFTDTVFVMYAKTNWSSGVIAPDLVFTGVGMFGASVAGGHDVTGDHVPDLIIGAPADTGVHGKVHVLSGGATPGWVAFTIDSACVGGNRCTTENLGFTVSSGPDIDDDGLDDIVVGSKYGGGLAGSPDRGRISVFPVPSYNGTTSVSSSSAQVEVVGEDTALGMCVALPGSPMYQPPPPG